MCYEINTQVVVAARRKTIVLEGDPVFKAHHQSARHLFCPLLVKKLNKSLLCRLQAIVVFIIKSVCVYMYGDVESLILIKNPTT